MCTRGFNTEVYGLHRATRWQGSYSHWEYCRCSDTRKVCWYWSWFRWSGAHENSPRMYSDMHVRFLLFILVLVRWWFLGCCCIKVSHIARWFSSQLVLCQFPLPQLRYCFEWDVYCTLPKSDCYINKKMWRKMKCSKQK